jgi:PKD domain
MTMDFGLLMRRMAALWLGCCLAALGLIQAEQAPPKPARAPWNIQSVRQKYYAGLDAARTESIRQLEAEGLSLSYKADGTVVRDAAFEKATQYYDTQRQSLLTEVRGNQQRDTVFNALVKEADAAIRRDGGAKPGQTAYSGALSDRDVELKTKADVERLTEEARRQGYHVVGGPGYVKILELDAVVWEPFRTHGPGGTELRHDDPEVMMGYEVIQGQKKASVVLQIKKVEEGFREEIPDSTQRQHELIASLSKAVMKSDDAIQRPGQEAAIDPAERQRYEQLKSRQLTKDDLISPFDRPEAQERELKELRQKAGRDLKTCLEEQNRQREVALTTLTERRTTLATALLDEQDSDKRIELERQISDLNDERTALEKDIDIDRATQRAITRKNPRLAKGMEWTDRPASVIPDQPGELTRISRVIDEALEISKEQEPRDTSATEAFDALADANRTIGKVLNSPFFKIFARVAGMSPGAIKFAEQVGKTSKAVDKNVISPTQKAIQSEGFVYETGDGMKEYIARRLKEEAAQGWDITDPRRQELIRREAILRATARGTYQGAKALPGLGKYIQFYEDAYDLTESSVGLVYDTWKSQQTADMNRFQQEGQLEQAILQAKESRDRLRKQMDTAAKAVAYSKEIQKLLPSLNADIEQLQQQIKDRRALLESLAPVDGDTPPAGSAIDPQTLVGLRTRMEALTRVSKLFTTDCEKAIARVKSGKIPHEELLEERGALQRRLMDEIDAEYIRIETLLDQVNARIRMVTEPDEIQNIYEALLLDYGQALALASTAEEIAGKLDRYELHYKEVLRCFTEERQRILAACDFFAQRPVGDENLQKRLSQMRGEMTEYHIADYQLQENWSQASALKREAAWLRKIAAETPKPPQGAVVSPTLRAEVEQLQKLSQAWKDSEAVMTAAVDEARAKFRELQDLLPLDPLVLELTARETGPMTYQFNLTALRLPEKLPPGEKLVQVWYFGEGEPDVSLEKSRTHRYSKPGSYQATVTLWHEKATFSKELAVAKCVVQIAPTTTWTHPRSRTPGQVVMSLGTGVVRLSGELGTENSTEREIIVLHDKAPAGAYWASSWITFSHALGSPEMDATFHLEIYIKQNSALLHYVLTVDGQARGKVDLQTGEFELWTESITWKERRLAHLAAPDQLGDSPLTDDERNSINSVVERTLGGTAEQLGWDTGNISGTIHWDRYGSASGDFEINSIFRGTWKTDPVRMYHLEWPETLPKYRMTPPRARLYSTEEDSRRFFTMRSRQGVLQAARPTQDLGDQAVLGPLGAGLVRWGRWELELPRIGGGVADPQEVRDLVTQFQRYVEDQQIERRIPATP